MCHRSLISRLFMCATMVAGLSSMTNPAQALIVSGGISMPAPTGGYIGTFNGSSCVAVGENWFVTAKHVGGGVGWTVLMRGVTYTVVEVRQHPTFDAQLLRVSGVLPGWHRLASGVALGDPAIVGGWGVTTSGPMPNDEGWNWGGARSETWGANTIEGEGGLLAIRFDAPSNPVSMPYEAMFAVNDSGGGLFVIGPDGSLQLAGIAVSVAGWNAARWGNAGFALNVDLLRTWMVPIVDPSTPISSGITAPRAFVGIPGLPVWLGGALLGAAALGRRRR